MPALPRYLIAWRGAGKDAGRYNARPATRRRSPGAVGHRSRLGCAMRRIGADEAARDLEAMQGAWSMVSFELNGEAVPEEQVKAGRLVVKGDKYAPTLGGRTTAFTIVLEPSTAPRAIDLTPDDGPARGQTLRGIYNLDRDMFTVCRG